MDKLRINVGCGQIPTNGWKVSDPQDLNLFERLECSVYVEAKKHIGKLHASCTNLSSPSTRGLQY